MALLQTETISPLAIKPSLTAAEKWATISLYTFLISMVAAPFMSVGERVSNTGEGNALRQILFLIVFLLAIVATRAVKPHFKIFAAPLSIMATLAYCVITLKWSLAPGIGIRRLFLTILVVMIIFMNVQILTFKQTTTIIRHVLIGVLFANFAVVALAPGIGIHRAAEVAGFGMDPQLIGSWKGVLAHKNFAGSFCAVTILFLVIEAKEWGVMLRAFLTFLALIFLWKSASKTSAGLAVIALFVSYFYGKYNHYYRVAVLPALGVFLAGVVGVIWMYWDVISKPFNRPDAFTGRVAIWRVLYRYWQDHPWGSGYGSFFNIGDERPIAHYTKGPKDWVSLVPEAHNGYMDLLISIGTYGMILAVFALLLIPISKLLVWRPEERWQGVLALAMLIFCAGHNLTESSFLDRDSIVEVFLMFAIALVEKTTRADRQRDLPIAAARNG
ncbi:O-antigen ligase family protein [Rhodoblastus sp.]|uniref:O-antigen ligase family protein n=1 Tax=Rhodoblastus sp. TaxID=1962975 RepID=UPI0035AE6CC4